MTARHARRVALACALAPLVLGACLDAARSDPATSPARAAHSPSAILAMPSATVTPVLTGSERRAQQWAAQVCGSAQGFLDAFVYGEPYGAPEEALSLAELQEHSAALTVRLVPAARRVAQLLSAVSPLDAAAGSYQLALRAAFRELAEIYARRGEAVTAAASAEAVAAVDARALADVGTVIASIKVALGALPPETQLALVDIPRCRLLA